MGVTVRLAGAFRLEADGTSGAGIVLGSPKERRLLALLAASREAVSTQQIVEALWGGDLPQRAGGNVATLVSRLRAQVGTDVIVGGRGVYRLGGPAAVQVDLDEAGRLVAQARRWLADGASALAGTAAARAMELLGTGSALVGEADADWVGVVRAECRELLRSARHCAAQAALDTGEPEAARRVAAAAVEDDLFDESAHRLLMRAHQDAGAPSKSVEAYQRLRAQLAEQLGVDPAPETHAVYLAVLRGERPPPAVADRRGRAAPPAPLVGRDAEVARLLTAWSDASQGQPDVLLLVGEAGIGKTRLATEAMAIAEQAGAQVLSSRCYAAERSMFLQPFVDALVGPVTSLPPDRLRAHAGARAASLAGLVPAVAEVLGVEQPAARLAPEAELRQAYEAVMLVLTGLATSRPVLLVLDDLHNAGEATVGLLHYLARHAGSARLLILATLRSEEGAQTASLLSTAATRLDVGPLDAAAVRRLAEAAGQAEMAGAILARTRGHSLFVVESLRALGAGESGLPESLKAAVLARLGRAGADIEQLLRAGSVLGAALDPDTVAGMLDLPPLEAARRCERAVEGRLLLVAGRAYEFANDLVQEVLYATTPLPTRLLYHRRAADLLAHSPEVVGGHAAAAGDWPRSARAYLLAGESAAGRGAVADAAALLTHALEAAERTGQLELVGRVLIARGRVGEAAETFAAALVDLTSGAAAARQAGDRRLQMIALRELGGDVPSALGLPVEDSVAHLRAGLRIAESFGDRAAEADLLARLAVIASHRLSFTQALAFGQRATAAGREAGDERALALGLDGLKTALAYLGDLQALSDVVEELEPLVRRQADLLRLHWTVFESAFAAVAAAEWDIARTRIGLAIELGRQSGYAGHETWLVAHLGWVARLQGELDEAEEHGRRAVTLSGPGSHRWWRPTAQALLAVTLLETGRADEAAALLTDALSLLGPEGPEAHRLRCLAALAEATGSRTVLDQADALLAGVTAPSGAAWLLGADAYLAVARSWLHQGRPERAGVTLAPLLGAAERHGWLPVVAEAALVHGEAAAALGDAGTAAAALAQALAVARRHGFLRVERSAEVALSRLP